MGLGPKERRLTRADLVGAPCRRMRQGCNYAADLSVFRVNGEEVLLKDFGAKSWPWRALLGRFLIWRESRVLSALDGVEGIPQFRGRPDRYSIVVAHVDGVMPRRKDRPAEQWAAFMAELDGTVARMHARGVVHLDLKHRTNLLVTPDGRPALLDFASGMRFDPRWLGGRLAARALAWLDRLAAAKWRRRLCPDTLPEHQHRRLTRTRRLEALLLPRSIVRAAFRLFRKESG